jgi:hypothetical protein
LPKEDLLSCQWDEFLAACRRREAVGHWRGALFLLAWLFIGAVSVYDAYLVMLYQVCILDVELNPIACCIMRGEHDVAGFLLAKALGTTVVLVILIALYTHAPRLAYPVIGAVSAFQMALLMFLNFA